MRNSSDALYEAASTAVMLAGGSFLSVLVAGLGSLVLARILGPEGYGAYSLVLAVPAFLMAFVDLGMSATMIRYLSKFPERAKSYATLGIIITTSAASLVTVIGVATSYILAQTLINRPEYSNLVLVSIPYLLAYTLFNVVRASLVGIGRRVKAASLEPLYNVLRVTLSIGLAIAMSVKGAVLGFVVASIVSSIVGLILLLRSLGKFEFGFDIRDLREVFRFSVPLYAAGLVGSLTQMYTTLTLSRFFTDFEIGNYRAALNLLTVVSIAIGPFSTAFLRVFSEADVRNFKEIFSDSIKYVVIFSVPLTLFSSAASHDIVRVVYGRRYTEADIYFSTVVLVYILTLLGHHVLGSALSAMNRTKYILLSNAIGSAVYIPLLYFLVSAHGLRGAAVSYVTLHAIVTLTQLCFLNTSSDISINTRFSMKVLVAALLSVSPLLVVPSGQEFFDSLLLLGAKFLFFSVVYVALLVMLRALSENEIYRISGLSKSLGPFSVLLSLILRYASLLIKLLQR